MHSTNALPLLGRLLGPDPYEENQESLYGRAIPVAAMACRHLIAPALWSALRRRDLVHAIPNALAEYLEAMHGLNANRNVRLRRQAADIVGAIAPLGTEPVFLKGMAILLLDVYDDPATRFVGDIDILLPRDLLEAGANRLVERGYRRLPDHAAHAHDPVKLAHPMQPGMIELHQAPVSLAIETIVPARDMLARAVPIEWLPGARVPCPDDLVTHNVAHAMLHHLYFRLAELPLRDAYDLVCVGERFTDSIDWFDVTGRLATGPWGADVFAFYTGAAASIFPEARLPPRRFSPRAAKVLRRWRGRRGRPPRRSEWARARLLEAAEDHCWRLRHVPREWSRLAIRLLAMHRYPSYVRRLICVARSHPQPPSPGRRRTAATWTEAS